MEPDGVMLNVVSAYAPQMGRIQEEKEAFWLVGCICEEKVRCIRQGGVMG